MGSEWPEYRLGEVTHWSSGGTPPKNDESYWNGDIPWISASSMYGNRYSESKLKITQDGLKAGSRLATEGSILLLVRGSMLHQKIPVGIAERDVSFNQDVKAINAIDSIVDPWFLLFWFMSNEIDLLSMVENTGIGAGKLDTTLLQNMVIRIPPLNERQAIVVFAKALDDKIELNRRMNATLEGMAQALFKSWFVDFDPVIDNALAAGNPIPEELAERAEVRRKALADGLANREAAKQFPAAFQLAEEMGWIPEGWDTQRLYDIAIFINGAAYKESDFTDDLTTLPVVKIAEIKNGISGQTKFTHIIKDEKYRISDGEILLTWSGNPDTSIDTFVWTDGEGWLNQHIFKVSLKDGAEKFFVYYQLKFLRSVFAEIARDKQTTGLGHFTGADMKRLMVFKPRAELLIEFNKTAASLYQRYYQNRLAEKTLIKLRDTTLPKLISGRLRIPDFDKVMEIK